MDCFSGSPGILRDFLSYHENIKGHSQKTVDEYFLDLRTFFRYIKLSRGLCPKDTPFEEISILDVDFQIISTVELREVYDFMNYLRRERVTQYKSREKEFGIDNAAVARKVAAIRSFYRYLTSKAHILNENPVQDLESPKQRKSLPRFLSLDECLRLLESVDGENKERDYAIILMFLTCGLRISELSGLNLNDIQGDSVRVLGKGNKTRIVYTNEPCRRALDEYLSVRREIKAADENALFLSRLRKRLNVQGIHYMLKNRFLQAGLDPELYSAHKLRHTSATLMLQNGVDVRVIQEVLGHDHLGTTEIYTHVENTELRIAAKANPLSKALK